MIEKLPEQPQSWVGALLFVVLATCGGVARYLQEYTRGRLFSIALFCAYAFIGGFSGYMFSQAMGLWEPKWSSVAAGTGGFFGAEAMKFLRGILGMKNGNGLTNGNGK